MQINLLLYPAYSYLCKDARIEAVFPWFVLFCKIPLNRRPGAYEDPIECNLFDFNRNDDDFLP